MFVVDPSLGHVEATKENIVSVIESINHPHVGVPGHDTQSTQAFVIGRRNANGSFSLFVALYLEETQTAVVYTSDVPEFGVDQYPEVEAEALMFSESMGFMVDNVNFRALPPDQQDAVIERIPAFHADPKAWAARNAPDTPEAGEEDSDDVLDLSEAEVVQEIKKPALEPDAVERIARLLASF